MSRIELKYCLISTFYLAALFDIVMIIRKYLNLINVRSLT